MGISKDITGLRFGKLTVMHRTERPETAKDKKVYWYCQCDCGNTTIVPTSSLTTGNTKSCGCGKIHPGKVKDLSGRRFGRLVVLEHTGSNKHKKSLWRCLCDCGNETVVASGELLSGDTQSCGCLHLEAIAISNKAKKTIHGKFGTRIYVVWRDMMVRCYNKSSSGYPHYGGRGIAVCESWHTPKNFFDWAYATGYDETAPKGECTLDRIDINGDYCPENCRWVNTFEQNCNRSITLFVPFMEGMAPLMKIARDNGINYDRLYYAITRKGMSVEEALNHITKENGADADQ